MSEEKEIEITIRIRVDKDLSLEELERLIDQQGDQAKREALKKALREKQEQERPQECRACGRRGVLYDKGKVPLRFHTLFGEVYLLQPRYRCPDCGTDVYPLRAYLQLISPGPVTPGVYRLVTLEGISRSYGQAALHVAEVSREQIRLSAKEVRGLVQRAGACYLKQREQETALLWADPDCARLISRQPGGLFCIQVDGGMVSEWQGTGDIEGKVAKMWWDSKRKRRGERGVITEKSYVGTFLSAEELGRYACAVSIAMGATEKTLTLLLGDGAEWIRETVWQVYFPWAEYRLDWCHLRDYVRQAVRKMWRDKAKQKEQGRRWVQLLWDGYADQVVAEVRKVPMPRLAGKKARDNLVQYITANRAGIGCYHLWYEQGELVSSSVVEKAVDEVIVRRQKKQGMGWTRAGADKVVALRALWLSGRRFWDQFWRGGPLLVKSNACLPI
jgi:hypothetical protein